MRGIRHAANRSGYNLQDRAWGLSLIAVVPAVSVELLELRVIRVPGERFLNRLRVENICVCGELNPMVRNTFPHVLHECLSVLAASLADKPRGDKFVIRVQRNVYPLAAKLFRIVLAYMPL